MGVMAYPLRYALADLALALSRAPHRSTRCGRPRPGRPPTCSATAPACSCCATTAGTTRSPSTTATRRSHRSPRRSTGSASCPDDDFSTALAASRRPVVLAADGTEQLTELYAPVPAQRGDRASARRCRPRPWPTAPGEPLAGEAPTTCTRPCCARSSSTTRTSGYLVLTRATPGRVYSDRRGRAGPRHRRRAGPGAVQSARALERLRASEERYRRVLETIPEGVLQLDADGVATYANEPIGVVLGMPRAAARRGVAARLPGRPGPGGAGPPAHRVPRRAGPRSARTRLMRADGSQRSVRMSMMPLVDEHGQFGGVLCMITDTTDHIDARGPQAPARPPAPAGQPGPADRRHLARLQQPADRGAAARPT